MPQAVLLKFLTDVLKLSPRQQALFTKVHHALGVTLDDFLDGKVFSTAPYDDQEITQILADLNATLQRAFLRHMQASPLDKPWYLTTAGAPGAGKTYVIESLMRTNDELRHAVYIDPDRVGLPALTLYHRDVANIGGQAAYAKWRDASNFIANFMLVMACCLRRNIIHGTTATNAKIIRIYQALQCANYVIKVKAFFAATEQRRLAIEYRAQHIIQATAEDMRNKELPVFLRIADAYLPCAAEVDFYMQQPGQQFWLDRWEKCSPINFALLKKTPGGGSTLSILNLLVMDEFINGLPTGARNQVLAALQAVQSHNIHGLYFLRPNLLLLALHRKWVDACQQEKNEQLLQAAQTRSVLRITYS